MSYEQAQVMQQIARPNGYGQDVKAPDIKAPTVGAAVARAAIIHSRFSEAVNVASDILMLLRGEVPPGPPTGPGNAVPGKPQGALFELRHEQECTSDSGERLMFLLGQIRDAL